jgi:hypothetical protein
MGNSVCSVTDELRARFDHSRNPHKPGSAEWKDHERAWLQNRWDYGERTNTNRHRTDAMKAQAGAHLAAVEEREAAGRRPLPAEWIAAMDEVEDQYPTRPNEQPWRENFRTPRGGIRFFPPPSLANAAVSNVRAIRLCEHGQPGFCQSCATEMVESWDDEPEVRTIRGKPAGRVKRCRPHGNQLGSCAECSRARR